MSDDAASWRARSRSKEHEGVMPDRDWVVLTRVGEMEAEILRAALETAEIPVAMRSESVGRLYGLSNQKLGEVTLLVPRDRETEARELIETSVPIDFPEAD
jgi:Putative prokaryotic signal transducing protein